MQHFESAPHLACHVAKLALPPGVASDIDQVCALSGVEVPAGTENLVPWKPKDSFRDQFFMADRRSRYVTQETSAILTRPFMQRYANSVISTDGWFKFASTNDVAWHLLNPPTPPFVMIFGVTQMQHLLWRAPLSLSRELFFVRLGPRLIRVRHSRVLAALNLAEACLNPVNVFAAEQGKSPIRAPFMPIIRELNTDTIGEVNPRVIEAAAANVPEAWPFIEHFKSLSVGDLWALGRIWAGRSIELTQPEPITITD